VFIGLSIGLKTKPLDVEIPTLQTKFEVKAVEHNSTYMSDDMHHIMND
jgi:hypothetical protein